MINQKAIIKIKESTTQFKKYNNDYSQIDLKTLQSKLKLAWKKNINTSTTFTAPDSRRKPIRDLTRFCKSTFTITFAVEITGIDVWHDCNEGWLDLGPPTQGMKIQYQLYPGQLFDLDILIWPHVAKIWCGNEYGFVRTWQFLERRWMAFSIRHAFPVRVFEFTKHLATVTPSMGLGVLSNNAKNDKNLEAYLPSLKFNERRYFGIVLEREERIQDYFQDYIWNLVKNHIPSSSLDGFFDKPFNITDRRQQDAVLNYVQEIILGKILPSGSPSNEEMLTESEEFIKSKNGRHYNKVVKEKKRAVEITKTKFEITLQGSTILSGIGRTVPFETMGERPPELPEVIVLISSSNLPAQDDVPVFFVNVDNLYDAPLQEFKAARFTELYIRWQLFEQQHDSLKENLKSLKPVKFNDHYTLPLQLEMASQLIPFFLDHPFEIQLRGVRNPKLDTSTPTFFGNYKYDNRLGCMAPARKNAVDEHDMIIAVTKIDASLLSKGMNGLVKGEFPLYPIHFSMETLDRDGVCTNDINAIRMPTKPQNLIPSHVILQSQMTLEVSIGLVGCRPKDLDIHYSRLYCLTGDEKATASLLLKIIKLNEVTLSSEERNDILTGFVIDTGNTVIFYVEGFRGGAILQIWQFTEDFYPKLKPIFSCSDKHISRIYSEMLSTASPYNVLKMFAPLNILLTCPYVYVKPALPLPARCALLKIGRLIATGFKIIPTLNDMPSYEELKSFQLELCVPLQPEPLSSIEKNNLK